MGRLSSRARLRRGTDQGTLAQRIALIVVLATVMIGTRPIVIALRDRGFPVVN